MCERLKELQEIKRNARYNLRLAHNRLKTAQKHADDVKADREYMYIGVWDEIIANAEHDISTIKWANYKG